MFSRMLERGRRSVMMKNQLSKREYKYRCKIIAENHLKKELQKYLDSYADSKWLTYKDVYFNKVVLLRIKAAYNFQSASKAMWKVGISAKQASDNLQRLGRVVADSIV